MPETPRGPHSLRPLHLVPLVLALAVSQAYGATGQPGTPGTNGVGPGAAGTSGTNGGDAAEHRQDGAARASGGNGGNGGNGGIGGSAGNGGAAGSGGNGGNASASAIDGTAPVYSSTVEAFGGRGGAAGKPGSANNPYTAGAAGNRGRGGDAKAVLGLTSTPRGYIRVEAGGGGGGVGPDINTDAVGGAAHAALTLNTPGRVTGHAAANGGMGGSVAARESDNSWGNGAAGGAASLVLDTRGADIELTAESRGGLGGFAMGEGFRAGDGAGATMSLGGSVGDRLKINVSMSGGKGGNGLKGADGGNGAALTLHNPVNLNITSGNLDLDIVGGGGSGGDSASGAAGRGGAADVSQVLDARQASSVALRLSAYGGDAGYAAGLASAARQGTVQAGADARSHLQLAGGGPVKISVGAYGGDGGGISRQVPSNNSMVDGQRGGDGTAGSVVTASTALASTSEVTAYGGAGGNGAGPDQRGGDGGNGYASGSLHNSGGGRVELNVTARAGGGGNGGKFGGNGGSTTLVDAVSGSTSGQLVLTQTAVANGGGWGVNGGNGGDAISRLTLTDGRSADTTATVAATGGSAGDIRSGTTGGMGGLGGRAEAVLDLTSTTSGGTVTGRSTATGGYGRQAASMRDSGSALAQSKVQGVGSAVSQATAISPGDARALRANVEAYARADGGTAASATALATTGTVFDNVARSRAEAGSTSGAATALSTAQGHEVYSVATARSVGAAANIATANADGLRGSALAQSTSSGNGVVVGTSASATVQGDTQSRTRTNVGGAAFEAVRPIMSTSGARSYASALPDDASMAPLLAAAPKVAAELAGGEIIGVGSMQASRALALTYDTNSYVTAANFQFDTTGERYLTLGLLGSLVQGTGLRELELTVSNHGTELFSQTFASIADAQLFFSDNALNLGVLGAGSQDVLVSAGFTYTGAGGFSFQYALGVSAVPEPQTWMLMLLGLTVVLVRRKARA